jgi:hypothetical protein
VASFGLHPDEFCASARKHHSRRRWKTTNRVIQELGEDNTGLKRSLVTLDARIGTLQERRRNILTELDNPPCLKTTAN